MRFLLAEFKQFPLVRACPATGRQFPCIKARLVFRGLLFTQHRSRNFLLKMDRKYRPILPKNDSIINSSNSQIANNFRSQDILGSNTSSFQIASAPVNNLENPGRLNFSRLKVTSTLISPQEKTSSNAELLPNIVPIVYPLTSSNPKKLMLKSATSEKSMENRIILGPLNFSGLNVTSTLINPQEKTSSSAVLPLIANASTSSNLELPVLNSATSEKSLETLCAPEREPEPSSANARIVDTKEKKKNVLASDSAIRIVEVSEFPRGVTCEDYNFATKNEKEEARTRYVFNQLTYV